MKFDNRTYRITDPGALPGIAAVIGVLGLLVSIIGLTQDKEHFFHSYLVAFIFWTSIGLGGLFFTLVHHLVDATWSVVVRKVSEAVMATLPWMVIFLLPILFFGLGDLYSWMDSAMVSHDHLLQKKTWFLHPGFFVTRSLLYFAVWAGLAFLLRQKSIQQDSIEGDKAHHDHLGSIRMISGPGMVLFVLTLTFASFDWMMSLDPHWYSTIFGVCFFSGSFVCVLAFMALTLLYLRRRGVLKDVVTVEHYHDLGKLMFAFIVFWTYVSFSQYFLIWYGNIPEETLWFRHRWEHGWSSWTTLLIFGHFVIPFFFLISRETKRNTVTLACACLFMVGMHWVEMFWQVMPAQGYGHFHLSWLDPVIFIGIGGIFVSIFWKRLCSQPLIPVRDPKLQESIRFSNQ
jgi:hypothetical protein